MIYQSLIYYVLRMIFFINVQIIYYKTLLYTNMLCSVLLSRHLVNFQMACLTVFVYRYFRFNLHASIYSTHARGVAYLTWYHLKLFYLLHFRGIVKLE